MIKKILLIFTIIVGIYASNCDNKLFSYSNSINISQHLSMDTFLNLLVTQKCGINIVYKDDIAKKILKQKMPYVRIKNYTLREILDLLLKQKGIFYTLKNNTLELSYFQTKSFKINFISSSRSGESSLNATDSKVTNTYNFNFWSKIEKQIDNLVKSTFVLDPNYTLIKKMAISPFKPVIDRNTGVIIVTGTMKQLNAVKNFVNNLVHNLTKEVLIDVHIYSVDLTKSHQTGIDWTNLSLSLNKTNVPIRGRYLGGSQTVFNSAVFNISGLLNFLAQYGNVNSISNPKIVTLNNQKAIISVGSTVYYKYASKVVTDQNGNPNTQYTIGSQFVGVVLDITPQISDDGTIILSIEPKLSDFRDPTQLTNTDRGMPPDTTDKTMLSVVKLKNNQTLVLGGLITDNKVLKVNGVPVLKEIPIIKYLFSSRSETSDKRELVFVITPHIIDLKHKVTLKDLGFGKF